MPTSTPTTIHPTIGKPDPITGRRPLQRDLSFQEARQLSMSRYQQDREAQPRCLKAVPARLEQP